MDANYYPINEYQNAMNDLTIKFKQSKIKGKHEIEVYCVTNSTYYILTFDCEVSESKMFPNDFDFADFECELKTIESCFISDLEYKPVRNIDYSILEWLKTKCELYYEEHDFRDDFSDYLASKKENYLIITHEKY